MSSNRRLSDPGRPKVVRTLAEANRVQAENERRLRDAQAAAQPKSGR